MVPLAACCAGPFQSRIRNSSCRIALNKGHARRDFVMDCPQRGVCARGITMLTGQLESNTRSKGLVDGLPSREFVRTATRASVDRRCAQRARWLSNAQRCSCGACAGFVDAKSRATSAVAAHTQRDAVRGQPVTSRNIAPRNPICKRNISQYRSRPPWKSTRITF